MEYRHETLDNGLTVLAELNPNVHALALGFFVRTGARDEFADIGGVSHFLEHMVFKGTAKRTAEDVNRELDEMGSRSNARTGEDHTIYHAAALPEFQSRLVELFADILRPSLRDDDFQTEQQVIKEEILMYDDQPPYGGHERIMAEYFGSHPLAQSILGTVETVGNLSPEQMRDYFARRYAPNNICLAAAGNLDFDQLVRDAQRYCGQWQPQEVARPLHSVTPRFGTVWIHKPQSFQQYILQLAPGPDLTAFDRYAVRILTSILGDDSGSRTFWEFLDTGLAEAAGIGNYEYDDTGVIMSFLCCEPDRARANLERLGELQANAVKQPITQRELDLAKSKISAQIILASERTENRMFSTGGQWLRNQEFKSPQEIAERYQAVTLEDIHAAAETYSLSPNMTVLVGPLPESTW